jgi:hypothetical protein
LTAPRDLLAHLVHQRPFPHSEHRAQDHVQSDAHEWLGGPDLDALRPRG